MSLNGERLIIIDDDAMVNEVLTYILGDAYDVKSYFSAEEALTKASLSDVDVIITDVNLPGMSGIEFLGRIQAVDPNIPVIVITALNDIDVAISALKNGAFDFILKPFNNDQIMISVRKATDRRRLLIENINLMEELRAKNKELGILNNSIQARNIEIENELYIASNLQQCLFPIVFPEIGGFAFALKYKPVEKVSGDFFDFLIFDEKHFSFIFADVSGHGVPAALYSAMVKTAISSLGRRSPVPSPAEFIQEMNTFLIESQKKMSYNYATIFYGHFDLQKETLSFCNAGIPAPVIIRGAEEFILLESNGPFVGIFETSSYTQDEVDLKKGDRLVFYTDGAFECTDSGDKILGQNRFLEIVKGMRTAAMPVIIDDIFTGVEKYCGPDHFIDDITILGMLYR